LGFETPLWLAAAALIAPLVWLYLRIRARPPATVSSLRIWKLVPSPATPPRRRPKLPLLFFIQALLIAASALALAGPFRREERPPGPPRDAVVVIDVSASMQAKREDGSTRFEAARDEAIEQASALAAPEAGKRVTVIRAGPQPEVIASGLDAGGAADNIGELEVLDTAANLTAAVELAANLAGRQGSIDVFTDVPADEIVMSRDARAAARVHDFGSPAENAAVTSVQVQSNLFDGEETSRVLVSVENFAPVARDLELRLVPLEVAADANAAAAPAPNASVAAAGVSATATRSAAPAAAAVATAAVADEPIDPAAPRTLHLEPGESSVVAFENVPWSGAFEARIAAGDDLPLDDVLYGNVPERAPVDVLLVTESPRLGERLAWLAARAGPFEVRTVAPKGYRPQEARGIAIFDRFVPELPPARANVAYLAPSKGNADLTVIEKPGQVQVAERREHPLLRGVSEPKALVGVTPIGLAPGALRSLLMGRSEGREVALLQAGEVGGRRIVATGFRFDPSALERADDLPSLVFLLNLLTYLKPEAADAPLLRTTGERLRAGSRLAAPIEELRGPSGVTTLGDPGADLTLERAGVYEAASASGTRKVLVSFVDPAESNVGRSGPVSAEPTRTVAAPAVDAEAEAASAGVEAAHVSLLPAVLFVVLAAMLLEWIVVASDRQGGRRAAAGASAGGTER